MRRHTWIISKWHRRLRRRKRWNHPTTHPWPVQISPQVMSFFPLQKIKGRQPTMTPSAWLAHLEEEITNKEQCIDSEDSEGIEGITMEFIVCLARGVKDAWQEEKCCYHYSSPDHFIHNCLLVTGSRTGLTFKPERGDSTREGWGKKGKVTMPKVTQDTQGMKMLNADSLLKPDPFN